MREAKANLRKAAGLLVLAIALVMSSTPARGDSPQDILVVANKGVSVGAISKNELRDIFLKKKTSWAKGGQAIPLHAAEGSELRKEFRRRVMDLSAGEEQRYWQQFQIKSGEPQPASFGNTLKAVFKIRGSVSYVFRSQYKEGVAKVLLVLPAG